MTRTDSFHQQLLEDSAFLKADRRLDTELVDKLILQLNRIYPQILTDKEATRFRNLDVPTGVRVGELLINLQGKDALDPFAHPHDYQQRYVLNDRGKLSTCQPEGERLAYLTSTADE
ncbi:hypothetical protein INR49_029615 [Caranx melampygus]|nr:hypothetical protein INR49_029615 [Caranx melampygus]